MNEAEKFEPYQASVTKETLTKCNGIVSVWNNPKKPIEGSIVIDEIKEPVEVTAVDEQRDVRFPKAELVKIQCGEGREGWVLSEALTVEK